MNNEDAGVALVTGFMCIGGSIGWVHQYTFTAIVGLFAGAGVALFAIAMRAYLSLDKKTGS